MKLKDARALLKEMRGEVERISIRPHAWKDHPKRKFSPLELVRLLQGKGGLHDNKYPTAVKGSFLWVCKDEEGRKAELAIIFETDKSGDLIVIIHAYREIKDEKIHSK